MDALHLHFARAVERLIKKKSTSINKVADFAGIGRGRLSEIVAGKSSPTLRTIGKIAAALGAAPRDLLP